MEKTVYSSKNDVFVIAMNVVKKLFFIVVMCICTLSLQSDDVYAAESSNWYKPVNGGTLSAGIYYPSGKYHGAYDYAVPIRTPVYSTCDGEVVKTEVRKDSVGINVRIKAVVNRQTVYMWYCHLSEIKTSVGSRVKAGQFIAYSGNTGNSTGPHLHYGVTNNPNYCASKKYDLNPSNYLPGTSYKYETFGDPVILPGVVDTSYSTPIQVVADHKCSTYDNRGWVESNRWIDAGDVCTIHEVYTNGFVKITYPVSGGTRDSYAKASDFTIPKEILPTGVTFNKSSISMTKGDSSTLTAYVSPSNAANKNVNWTSSNNSVATVSGGVVRAVGGGTAIITATTAAGGKKATCVVKVSVPVTGVSLNESAMKISQGTSVKLTSNISPSDATNKSVSWTSSNTSVLTVVNGTVRVVGTGKATVTAKTDDGGKTATCQFLVIKSKKHYYGDMDGNGKITITDFSVINQIVNGNDTLNDEMKDRADVNGDGKVDSTDLKLVQDFILATITEFPTEGYGDINGDGEIDSRDSLQIARYVAGQITLTEEQKRRADVNGDGKIDSNDAKLPSHYVVGYIGWFPADELPSVTGISMSKTLTMEKGKTKTITANVLPSNAGNKTVKWYSEDTNVVTINNNTITAVGTGKTKVNAITVDGAYSASCEVTVTGASVGVIGLSLDKSSLSIVEGDKATLVTTITPSNATNKNVRWTSSNSKVATVSNGTVTAVSIGTATITARTVDGGKTASCTVTVINKPVNIVEEEKKEKPCFVVSKVSGEPGQEAVVDISIKNNPGIAGLKVVLEYPSDQLELTDVKYQNLFSSSGSGGDVYKSPFIMTWFSASSRNETANGVFARAVFKVKEDVKAGEYAVCLKYDTADVIDTDGEEISFLVEDGNVVVEDSSMSGDVNGDGKVNMKDIVILQQKLNGWDITVHKASADMNHDGALNMKDIVLLQKYLNGWN